MTEKVFLYIDILGFSKMINNNSIKIEQVFQILDSLKVHKHFAFKTIVFSDTILVFNENEGMSDDYYITYLCEFVLDLFYRTIYLNVFFRAIITKGEFKYQKRNNIESYYGKSLVDCYKKEKELKSIGLFIDKSFSKEVITFNTIDYDSNLDFIILNQSFDFLNSVSNGQLPIDYRHFEETDMLGRIDEDLLFFREIKYLKENHPSESVKLKYKTTYDLYRSRYSRLFETFEKHGFLPMILNSAYTGSINPFEIRAEKEIHDY